MSDDAQDRSPVDLYVLGAGVSFPEHLTLQTLDVLAACRRICTNLPQSDVDRIIGYAASTGKRSFIAMVPDNAYGTVVEASFNEIVARSGGRVVALRRYPSLTSLPTRQDRPLAGAKFGKERKYG